MNRKRRITNSLGQILVMSLTQTSLRLQREDGDKPDVVEMDCTGAEILHGYIASSRLAGKRDVAPEVLEDKLLTRFEHGAHPVSMIRIIQKASGAVVDIDAPFWETLYCELGLTIPHMREVASSSSRTLH